jgi:hypothetical protein
MQGKPDSLIPSLHTVAPKTLCSASLQPNRNLTRHSTHHNPSECYYGRRHFVDTADEDPLIEALERQVQASKDGRKMGRSALRLGNFCWDKRVVWRGRGRDSYKCSGDGDPTIATLMIQVSTRSTSPLAPNHNAPKPKRTLLCYSKYSRRASSSCVEGKPFESWQSNFAQ